MQKKNPDKQLR